MEAAVEAKEEQSFKAEFQEDRTYPPDLYCSLCNRLFLTKQNMKRHMQTHSGVKPHQCRFCTLSFLRLSHLQRHLRTHTGERPFQCNQCDRQFSRSDKLKQHVVQHHSGIVIPKEPKQRGRPRKVSSMDDRIEGWKDACLRVKNWRFTTPRQKIEEKLIRIYED